jgi:hydroxymethylbilane synthase
VSARAPLRVGTRGSALALWQTERIRQLLTAAGHATERIEIRTTGDMVQDVPLSRIGSAALFTRQIDEAMLAGRIDIAVHSLKDLPTELPAGIAIAAIGEREDPSDALVGRGPLRWREVPEGAVVATSSLRRRAQLLHARPDLGVQDIRGNVDTRLGRVRGMHGPEVVEGKKGDLDAVVLAAAGLTRLGRTETITELLDPSVMLPAPGQGALAVECRAADAAAETVLSAALREYDDVSTRLAVTAERSLLARLEAGCSAPIGALAARQDGKLVLEAVVCSPDGRRLLRRRLEAPADGTGAALDLGVRLAEDLLAEGAAELTPLAGH